MRCYLVQGNGAKRYAATAADAARVRKELSASAGVSKTSMSVTQVEIETAKVLLLDFINGLCKELDTKGSV